jgi:TetR/AcrR family transcriptional regulator, transcriptional repressor for nem operon
MGRNAHIQAPDTEKFIIEKIAVLFNKKGYAATSLSDLEKATGLTKGSIYANFKDKEAVSLKVFDYNYHRLTNNMFQRIAAETTTKGKLLASIDFYLDFYSDLIAGGGCAIQNSLVETDDTNKVLFEKAKAALISWKETTANIIKEGIAQKEISDQVSPADFAIYMIALIEGAILVSKSLNNEQAFQFILTRLKGEIISL